MAIESGNKRFFNPRIVFETEAISELPPFTTVDEFEAAGGVVSDNCAIDRSRFDHVGDFDNGATCPKTITRTYRVYDY